MAIAAIILSSLALAAATGSVVLTLRERKRNLERNAVQMDYADSVGSNVLKKAVYAASASVDALVARFEEQEKGIEELRKGIVPDFEKAKAAAEAVNSFNSGITGILGFDPYDALKAARAKDGGGVGE